MRLNRLIPAAMLLLMQLVMELLRSVAPGPTDTKVLHYGRSLLSHVFNARRRMASLQKDDNPLKPIMTKQRWFESPLNPCWSSLTKVIWCDRFCGTMAFFRLPFLSNQFYGIWGFY